VFVLVHLAVVEDARVEEDVGLLVGLAECLVLALLEVEELVLHVDALLVLDDDDLVVGVVPLVLEPAQLLDVDLLAREPLVVHLHAMQAQFLGIPEGDELLGEAVLVVADVVRDLEVHLHAVVVLVVAVLLLRAANVAEDVLDVDVALELVLVEEVLGAELAVGVHEGDVAELVDVALLQVLVQRLERVQLLLLQHARLLLYADLAGLGHHYQM
jgi:hypothetical protein